jgi:phosphoribosylformylglycinamidine cyclo-ligase
MEAIVKGISDGCLQAGCALIGGETAEMPGMYQHGEYDIAGFTVGIVDHKHLIDGSEIKEGHVLIGLASTGIHSNGFSLVRKVLLEEAKFSLGDYVEELGSNLGEVLLEPTKIYVKSVLSILKKFTVFGLVHVTGGGFYDNIPRILPKGFQAEIHEDSWKIPKIFSFIQQAGEISNYDMFRTFNMGIGMILVVDTKDVQAIVEHLQTFGEEAYLIGTVRKGTENVVFRKE